MTTPNAKAEAALPSTRRFFNPHKHPELLAGVEALNAFTPGEVDKIVAVVLAARRRAQLAERGITVDEDPGLPCPCYLRDPRGHQHRRRGNPHYGGLCYPFGRMVDHLRGWYRDKQLVAVSFEPYNTLRAKDVAAAAEALAADELSLSICSCCAVWYPARTAACVITRAQDARTAHDLWLRVGTSLSETDAD